MSEIFPVPKSLAELTPILEAIEGLLAAGDFKAADDLYFERLENGKVFHWIPAPREGLRCSRAFVDSGERRAALQRALGEARTAFYVNDAALWGSILGEMEGVERAYEESIKVDHERGSWANVCAGLLCLADAQTFRGTLREAAAVATEALFYAGIDSPKSAEKLAFRLPPRPELVPSHDAPAERDSRAYRAHALSLGGELTAASRDFASADAIEREQDAEHEGLCAGCAVDWARHLFRLGDAAASLRLAEANRAICQRYGWNQDIARCELLLGELDMASGAFDSAASRITEALRVFREADQVRDLPDALLAQARLRRSVEDCNEALRLATGSRSALKQCDALNLRARLQCESAAVIEAAEDARHALEIAERCDYYWGRQETLRTLRDAARFGGNRTDEARWHEAETELAARMQPQIEEALRISREHEREMEVLYRKEEGGPGPGV